MAVVRAGCSRVWGNCEGEGVGEGSGGSYLHASRDVLYWCRIGNDDEKSMNVRCSSDPPAFAVEGTEKAVCAIAEFPEGFFFFLLCTFVSQACFRCLLHCFWLHFPLFDRVSVASILQPPLSSRCGCHRFIQIASRLGLDANHSSCRDTPLPIVHPCRD